MGPRREAEKKAKLFSPSMALQMSSSSSSAATSLSFRPSVTSFISNINNNVSFQTSLKPARRFKTLVFIKKSPKRLIYASPRLPKMRYRNWMKHYQFSSQINMRLCGVWEHGLLYIEVDPEGADTWKLDAAVEFLKNGAVGVIPTDTVYAMVCDMTNHDAIERLRRLEEVETGKPFSILCRSLHDIDTYTTGFPRGNSYGFSDYFRAVKHCVPGPYTFILTASKALPKQCVLLPKKKTLGVRIPDDVVCQAVLEKMGAPLISTSVRSPVENQWILDPVLIADTYGPVGLNFVIDAGVRVSNPSTVLVKERVLNSNGWLKRTVQLKKETELTPRTYKHASGLRNFIFPYLSKLDTGWGRDRATGLQAEDISQACEDTNNKTQVVLSFSSDSEDEVVEVTNTQIISSLKKRKKVSPPTESSHKKKKPMTLQDTMDTKLDSFASDFKSVCGKMVEKIGVAANALTVDGDKSECVSEEKMQGVMNELLNISIYFPLGCCRGFLQRSH